jgi:CBS domain-containing protein
MANEHDGRERGPCHYVRFGGVAVRKRYIDGEQLHEALVQQRQEDAARLPHRRVGEILLEMGWLSPWELEDVLLTLADLASGSSRTGDTPSEAFAVGAELRGDDVDARPSRPSVAVREAGARLLVRDVMDQVPTATADCCLGDALEAAFEVEADAVLVMEGLEILGFLSVWDVCQLDRGTLVGKLLGPAIATVSESTSVAEATRILRASDAPCVAVVSGVGLAGVVTRRELRRSGVLASELDEDTVPFRELELGVGG